MHLHAAPRAVAVGAAALAVVALTCLVAVSPSGTRRTALEFANKNDYLANNFVWSAPYPGAGPETPEWAVTPGSVGQDATEVMDEAHREHNVLGNDYKYPDYARRSRQAMLWQQASQRPQLWVGSPQKMLPPNGDYPGGSTGIPEDGYVAFETGYGADGPYHGLVAPMQEAGIMARQVYPARRVPSGFAGQVSARHMGQLSIIDPGQSSEQQFHGTFNDWELGNSGADLAPPPSAQWGRLEGQPIDDLNMGKWTCTMGADCHDRTHQAGLIDGGKQYYDEFAMGSIDRNSPRSIHAEYKTKGVETGKLAMKHHVAHPAQKAAKAAAKKH
mmetsp:Transcript_38441/g.75077  ORF Transcript_38441/g.75077 Transcript_38441/m.75077 type:complete len:329 (+) Transcript_38441:25-1011(+)|eukprot:CAMPEP_0173390858 /NCGR_PEP_ID=MMETSP1356-20130122/16380_1 /TAXON_ID=77927 ORGANISM="Hemiselmis virescens, Strain PCC157" /NCGR_SAMPLE_ID=MMETSP1356 /ASSEMBLY_ACC=CAM_ASM_000847 /LENGTH=328 /DNA_ID=CAMNT_0014348345 /DNA_START=22 /DNA_END=1008 /DNA_ORIENTATION=-